MEATLGMSAIPHKNIKNDDPRQSVEDSYRDAYAKFVDIASHDLRAPLRKLGVLTDRLVSRFQADSGEEIKNYTDRMHACIAEMQTLIDGFSEYAGASSSSMSIESCDLADIAEKTLREFTTMIREKQADIKLANLPMIQGDNRQLRLLFRKILENVFKFSRNDETLQVVITGEAAAPEEIRERGLAANEKYYRIAIKDNGIGFNDSESENIFQPLVRLHGKSSFPGSGLGLSIVKRIAENHQGLVFAEGGSKGAEIILVLPENQN